MNMVGRNPLRELEALTDPLNRFFVRPETRRSTGKEMMAVADWAASTNIGETEWEFHTKTEFPGLKNETVRVTLDKGKFILQSEQKEEW